MNKDLIYKFLDRKVDKMTSPVRRIEKVFPVKNERLTALVLDCTLQQGEYGIRKAAEMILSKGFVCSILVDGDAYTYYHDELSFAAENGFDFVNGGFSGRPYTLDNEAKALGKPLFAKADMAADDLLQMKKKLSEDFGQDTYLAYPPYGMDRRSGELDLYDIFDMADHDYLKGSMHLKEGSAAVLSDMLRQKAADLNGQIIFVPLKYVSELETVFNEASQYGVRFCTARELLSKSPFADIGPDESYFADAKRILEEGYPIAYRNNKFCPKPYMVSGELAMTLAPKGVRMESYELLKNHKFRMEGISLRKPYAAPLAFMKKKWLKVKPDFPVTSIILSRALEAVGIDIRWKKRRYQYHRWEVLPILAQLLIDERPKREAEKAELERLLAEAEAEAAEIEKLSR